MMLDKLPTKKVSRVQETLVVSWRFIQLVWSIDRLKFSLLLVLHTIPGAISFVNIYIYKLVIDWLVLATTGGVADITELYYLIGLRILTYFVEHFIYETQEYIEALMNAKVSMSIGSMVLAKTSSLDIYYHENSKFKELLEKAGEYFWRPKSLLLNLMYVSRNTLEVAIALVAVVQLNWLLILPILLVIIPEFIRHTRWTNFSYAIYSDNSPYRNRFWYLRNLLLVYYYIKEVKLFKLAPRLLKEVNGIEEKFYQDTKKTSGKLLQLNLVSVSMSNALFIGVEVYVIFQALSRRLTIGDIGFYTGVVGKFQSGLSAMVRNFTQIYEQTLYVKNIFDLLDLEPMIKVKENAIKLDLNKAPTIEFKNVFFTYADQDKPALDSFNLVINPGEKIAFVGENGAGKTTIIKLLTRLYDVDSGEILINGNNIKDLDLQNWYEYIGVLFQDFNKYEHTVKENIHFGKASEQLDINHIQEAAKDSGAHPFIEKLESKYEQMLGRTFEKGTELSVGQWQKLALARAFFRNAPVLVLDEPTASIDAKAESEIFSRVEKLSKDKTVIIISHRFSTVRNADKIYVIENGKIKESGSHQELMKIDGQYATLFNLQAKGYQ